MLNVFIELDNLLGDGQDVFGPAVSVGLQSLGGEVAWSFQGECFSKGPLVGGQELQWEQSPFCFGPASASFLSER